MKKTVLVLSIGLLSLSTLTGCHKKKDEQDRNMSKKEDAQFQAQRKAFTKHEHVNIPTPGY